NFSPATPSRARDLRGLARFAPARKPRYHLLQSTRRPMAKNPTPRSEPQAEPITPDSFAQLDGEKFARNMLSVGIRSQRLLSDFIKRAANGTKSPAPLDPLNVSGAFLALAKAMSTDRQTVIDSQLRLWKDWMELWESTALRILGGVGEPVIEPAPGDRRFRDAEWRQNEIFDFLKQSYLLAAGAVQNMVAELEGIPDGERKRIEFYTRQFADALAPTNFPLTNPEVLRATLQSNGENLVKGLDNLLADIQRGRGELSIRQSADGFVLGENIATAPGNVVFRNELIELIQYKPTTDQVYERPLL